MFHSQLPPLQPLAIGLALAALMSTPARAQTVPRTLSSPDGSVTLSYTTEEGASLGPGIHGLQFTEISHATSSFSLEEMDPWSIRFWKSGALFPANVGNNEGIGATECSFGGNYQAQPATPTSNSFVYTWEDASFPGLTGMFDVTVTVVAENAGYSEFPATGRIEMRVRVLHDTTGEAVHSVVFPRLAIEERGLPENQFLATASNSGVLFPDPIRNSRFPSDIETLGELQARTHPGGLSMQFYAYYDQAGDSPLLFMGTRDTKGDVKEFFVANDKPPAGTGALFLRLNRFPPDNHNTLLFEPDYPFVLTVMRGDWYDASRYYRNWVVGGEIPAADSWTVQGPMRDNDDFSPSLKAAQMLLITSPARCCYDLCGDGSCFATENLDLAGFGSWADQVVEHQSFFNLVNTFTLIYAWDYALYGGSLGNWCGTGQQPQPEYASASQAIQGLDHPYANYFNPHRFSMAGSADLPPWDDGCRSESVAQFSAGGQQYRRFVQLNDNSAYLAQDWVGENIDLLGACGSPATVVDPMIETYELDQRSTFLSSYTQDYAELTAQFGSSGLYLDALTSKIPEKSYNADVSLERGLPNGGGSGWTQGKLATVEELVAARTSCAGCDDTFVVMSEGAQEMFNKYVNVVHPTHFESGQERFEDTDEDDVPDKPVRLLIPAYQTVYHDYQMFGEAQQIIGPSEFAACLDPDAYRKFRMGYASRLFFGHSLFGGSLLMDPQKPFDPINDPLNTNGGQFTIAEARAGSTEYTRYTNMIKNFAKIMRYQVVRNYTTMGERVRDPEVTSFCYFTEPDPGYLPYDEKQPFCYTAAYRKPGAGGRPSLGVVLLNWSHSTDLGSKDVGGSTQPCSGGGQSLVAKLDPQEYGLSGIYQVSEVVAGPGSEPKPSVIVHLFTHDFSNPLESTLVVPQLNVKFYLFTPI